MNTRVVNVLSKSLGVVARDDKNQEVVVYLLPRNSEVPLERSTDFGTDAANQVGVDIRVMAGERDSPAPDDCKEVGTATLTLPANLPARSPIRVKFAINREGRLFVCRDRPDRRRLTRSRIRDRSGDERRGCGRAVDGACGCWAFLECASCGGSVMQTIDQGLLDEVVDRLAVEFHPEQIILFGSHAWGDTVGKPAILICLSSFRKALLVVSQKCLPVPTVACAVSEPRST